MFVGRDGATAGVLAALRADGGVVLVGLGGVGKSTLARQVVERLAPDHTVWLDADRLDPDQSLDALLLDSVGDRALAGESDTATMRAATEGRRLVVVVDGADARVDESLTLTRSIPTAGDGPWVVITSRVRPTSTTLPVVRLTPFDVESAGGLSAAVELFRGWYRRAGGADDSNLDQETLTPIVTLTGGIPLALRVAAAMTAATGVDAAKARLAGEGFDDLTHCVDHSIELLAPMARAVFDSIAVTSGWVDIDSAAAISGLTTNEAAAALGSLVQNNLIEAEADGYRMLPPIHRIAVAKLTDPAALWGRCRSWCEAIVEHEGLLVRHEQDVRLVIGRLLQSEVDEEVAAACELTRALSRAQFGALLQHIAADHLTAVLASPGLQRSSAIDQRVELLRLLAIAQAESRGVDAGLLVLDEADRLAPDATESASASARLLSLRAALLHDAGAVREGLELTRRTLAVARGAGDRFNEVQSRINEANMLQDLGRLAEAHAAAVWVGKACDDSMASFAQRAQSARATIALEQGDRALCEALGRKQMAEATSPGEAIDAEYLLMLADPIRHANTLKAVHHIDPQRPGEWMVYLEAQAALATQALVARDPDQAMTIASDIVVVAEALPLFWMRLEGLLLVGDAALVGGASRQAWIAYRTALDLASTHGWATRTADAVEGLARLTIAGDRRRAALSAAAAIRAACDADRRPRPWLPPLPVSRSSAIIQVPDGWIVDGSLASTAFDLIVTAASEQSPSNDPSSLGGLSPAELRVARLVALGHTNREIGAQLHISRRTVETHIVHAFQKLGVQNRTQLATTINASTLQQGE